MCKEKKTEKEMFCVANAYQFKVEIIFEQLKFKCRVLNKIRLMHCYCLLTIALYGYLCSCVKTVTSKVVFHIINLQHRSIVLRCSIISTIASTPA